MTITLAQLTDLHLSVPEKMLKSQGLSTEDTLRRVLAHAELHRADAVICTGDLTDTPSAAAYTRLYEMLDALPAPVFCLPGNHDDLDMARALADTRDIQWPRSMRLGCWLLLMLDSSVAGEVFGYLSEAEFAALHSVLQAHSGYHTLVCLHHHPLPVGSAWVDAIMLKNGTELLQTLARYPQVRGVVWGHTHQETDLQQGSLRLLGTPSTCRQFAPATYEFTLDDKPPAFRLLRLHDNGEIETRVLYCP